MSSLPPPLSYPPVEKQDKLLFVALYILLNLAEEPTVEKKMVKKELIPHLCFMLSRRNADLLVLSVTFLRKLSVIEENKDAIRGLGAVPKLIRFIPCSSQALVNNVFRLLFNLSFDKVGRKYWSTLTLTLTLTFCVLPFRRTAAR